ncbi:hypothetical protein OQJ19_12110 [Fluoribacter gormanii]|uniref:hypothetical protein n=1 Tax=Fluoribacter gormanii TaxID=464 RepID=UPI002243CD14|nr:hypothetical protein [Fluoribacter gormanii]MCW8471385.1 hypothetical protein [Fluoribacter gormanii]
MKNSRKQIIAQIELMSKTLHSQKSKVIEHQKYFTESAINRYHLTTLLLLISAFFIGWRAERKQWSGKVMRQIVDIGKLAVLNSFKKTVVSLFK